MRTFIRTATAAALLSLCSATADAAMPRNQEFQDATPEELAMKEAPGHPGAHAVILHWSDIQDDNNNRQSAYFRIKILTEEGKKYGDIELPFVRGITNVSDIKARTIRPDGTIVPFNSKVFDKLVIKSRGVKVMAKTFTLPEVQPGAIIEYRYAFTWPPVLYPTHWTLQRELPVLKASLYLAPYRETSLQTYFLHFGVGAEQLPKWVRDHYEVELTNLPAFEEEAFSPPEAQLKPRITFFYNLGKLGTPDEFWKKFGKESADEVERFIGNRSGIKKAVDALVLPADDPTTKLKKIYGRVQQLENLSFEEEKSAQEERRAKRRDSRHVEDLLTAGYGYRGQLNRLFVAMARAAGLEANTALVATRDETFFWKELLTGSQFDVEVASVMIDGKEHFFDPGTPAAPFGMLPWDASGVPTLRLQKKDDAVWTKTPEERKEAAQIIRRASLRLDEGILKGTVRVEFTGQQALVRRMSWLHDDDAARRKAFEDEVKTWLPEGAKVTIKSLDGTTVADAPITGVMDVELPGLESAAGSRTLLRLSVFESRSKNPFAPEKRKHSMYFEYNNSVIDEVDLELPAGYSVESLPRSTRDDLRALTFDSKWTRDETSVKYKRQLDTDTLLVGVENYKLVRSFFSKIQSADEENLVLRKQ